MTNLYILSNSSIVNNPIKIGIADDINQRLKTLNTSVPQKFQVAYALECESREDAIKKEKLAHKIFGKHRAENGEFFYVDEDIATALFETWGPDSWEQDEIVITEMEMEQASPAISFKFSMIGLKSGDIIINKRNGEKAKVASENTIIWRGEETSLSESARKIKGEVGLSDVNTPRGPNEWLYKGETLDKIRERVGA